MRIIQNVFLDKKEKMHLYLLGTTSPLTLCTLSKIFSRRYFEIIYFSQKTGFDISCKLSPQFA